MGSGVALSEVSMDLHAFSGRIEADGVRARYRHSIRIQAPSSKGILYSASCNKTFGSVMMMSIECSA